MRGRSRRGAVLALGVGLLFSPRAAAQTQQGVLAGLNLLYRVPVFPKTEALYLSVGTAWIHNDVVGMSAPGELFAAAGVPVDLDAVGPTNWAASSVYYCYVTLGQASDGGFVDTNFTSTSGQAYSLLCSSTAPACGGIPSAAIKVPNSATAATTDAAFVGSFVTDGNINIVPFYRNGEEVVFAEGVSVAQGSFDTGIWSSASHVYAAAAPANWNTTALWACPPGSASACLLDVHYTYSGTSSSSTTYVLV